MQTNITEPPKLLAIAGALFDEGRFLEAAEHYNKALDIFIATYGDTHIEIAGVYSKLGDVCVALKDYQLAAGFYARALDTITALFGQNSIEVAAACNKLGEACHWLGAYQTAIEFYNRALKNYLQLHGRRHQDVVTIYNNLAFACFDNGDAAQAETHMQTALQILQTMHADVNHPAIKGVRQNLAFIRDNNGRGNSGD